MVGFLLTFVNPFFVTEMVRLLSFFVFIPVILSHITFEKLGYFSNTCGDFIILTIVAICDAMTGPFVFREPMEGYIAAAMKRFRATPPPRHGWDKECFIAGRNMGRDKKREAIVQQ